MSEGFSLRLPDGDTRERMVCGTCGHIAYDNPKIVVGSVVATPGGAGAGQVLLCRRAIEPRRGFWTLPAGFMEHGEAAAEGAAREAMEEARAAISIDGLLAVYSIPRIGQVQLMFRARFAGAPDFGPGPESEEVALFGWAAIPWDAIAFPSVHWALAAWRANPDGALGAPDVEPSAGVGAAGLEARRA
jgi:ADP-ribose pyrophosphatase YjhB (NUDIX family)